MPDLKHESQKTNGSIDRNTSKEKEQSVPALWKRPWNLIEVLLWQRGTVKPSVNLADLTCSLKNGPWSPRSCFTSTMKTQLAAVSNRMPATAPTDGTRSPAKHSGQTGEVVLWCFNKHRLYFFKERWFFFFLFLVVVLPFYLYQLKTNQMECFEDRFARLQTHNLCHLAAPQGYFNKRYKFKCKFLLRRTTVILKWADRSLDQRTGQWCVFHMD